MDSKHFYLAIDPGNNTGYAWFAENGDPTDNGAIKGHDEFLDWLEDGPVAKIIIMEDYKVRPGNSGNHWSNVPTLQLIGAIKRYAKKNNITVEMVQPQNLYMGLRLLGMYEKYAPRTVHVPDRLSALAHGVHWLTKRHIYRHPILKKGSSDG